MICPKCGYEQEERIDCLRCGVVFSKYYQLHPEAKKGRIENAERPSLPPPEHSRPAPAAPPAPSGETDDIELAQIRLSLRDITRKLSDLDVERAERVRLRGDLSNLDQRINENLKNFTAMLTELQLAVGEFPPVEALREETKALREELREHILSLREKIQSATPAISRIEQIEARLEATADRALTSTDAEMSDRLRKLEEEISALDRQALAPAQQPARWESDASTLELGKVLKELDALRTSLQNVTVRYSEIGELKKNHLELSHSIEALEQKLGQGKGTEPKSGSKMLSELGNEVAALRAESRQALKQMQTAEAIEKERLSELQNLKEALHSEADARAELDRSMESAIAGLESRMMEKLGSIPREVSDCLGRVSQVEERLETLRKSIGEPHGAKEGLRRQPGELADLSDPRPDARLQSLETRFAELERRMKPVMENSRVEPTDALLELGKVLRELDGVRSTLQSVTSQCNEITGLKKDYVDLSDAAESLRQDFSAFRNQFAKETSGKIAELSTDRSTILHDLHQVQERLHSFEATLAERLSELETRPRTDPQVLARIPEMESRFADLEKRFGSLGQQFLERVEHESASVRKDVESLRHAQDGISVRYSEIGELKKNQLVTSDRLDTIQQEIAAIKSENSLESLSTKAAVLAKEVAALKAEWRQVLNTHEALETQIAALRDKPPPEPVPPVEEAIHAIRQNLDEIRRFMSTISGKL